MSIRKLNVTVLGKTYEVLVEDMGTVTEAAFSQSGTPFITPTFSSETQSKEEKPLVRITAPVDGSIVKVSVKPGDHITMGDPLCVIEAMQMKNTLPAPKTGIIEEVFVAPGLSVEAGAVLFTLR